MSTYNKLSISDPCVRTKKLILINQQNPDIKEVEFIKKYKNKKIQNKNKYFKFYKKNKITKT
jgi:hypothetical protein